MNDLGPEIDAICGLAATGTSQGECAVRERLLRIRERRGDAEPAEDASCERVVAKLREHAMREWSRGNVDTALALLDPLAELWPDDAELAAERLQVLVNTRIEDPRAGQAVQALSEAAWGHRRIALLATYYHLRRSGFAELLAAAGRWARAERGTIAGLERLAREVSLTIAFKQLLGPNGLAPDVQGRGEWTLQSAALLALAREMMRLPRDLREFHERIFLIAIANLLQLPQPLAFMCIVLESLCEEELPAEFLGQILAFYLAYGDVDRARLVAERVRRDETLLACPHLAKFMVVHAQLAADRGLEAAILARVLREGWTPQGRDGVERLQVHELVSRAAMLDLDRFPIEDRPALLEARARIAPDFAPIAAPFARSKSGPPRIAIGLFGQLRDPQFALPKVARYFRDEFAAGELPGSTQWRFLLATWNHAARRRLEHGYPVATFTALLPQQVARVVEQLGLRTSSDLAHAFPALFAELLRRSADAEGEIGEDSAASIREALGRNALVEIADEAPCDRDIEAFCEVHPNLRANVALRNQFKMYERIAGVGRLVEQWEREDGAAVDLVVLTRPDMLFESGSVMLHARGLLAAPTERSLVCDWNPALMNEGFGDNIIIATRRAIAPLFAAYARLTAAFAPDAGELAVYRRRIWGHQFLASTVFAEGIDFRLIPREAVRWQLHRRRLDLAAVHAALVADARSSPVAEARQGLAAVVSATGSAHEARERREGVT